MKHSVARWVAWLCVAACTALGAVELSHTIGRVRTEDHNGDGRPDIWRHYDDGGRLTEVDVDSNFDGSPDIEEYYRRGVLVRRESDRNFNGQADLVEEFDAETHGQTRSVVDTDYDGVADLLVLFRDGRPVFSRRTQSQTPAGIPTRGSLEARPEAANHLAPLTNPFDSDMAVRATRIGPNTDGCVGLSSSGGLPCPRITTVSRLSASAQAGAFDQQSHALTVPLRRSPRAPPLS